MQRLTRVSSAEQHPVHSAAASAGFGQQQSQRAMRSARERIEPQNDEAPRSRRVSQRASRHALPPIAPGGASSTVVPFPRLHYATPCGSNHSMAPQSIASSCMSSMLRSCEKYRCHLLTKLERLEPAAIHLQQLTLDTAAQLPPGDAALTCRLWFAFGRMRAGLAGCAAAATEAQRDEASLLALLREVQDNPLGGGWALRLDGIDANNGNGSIARRSKSSKRGREDAATPRPSLVLTASASLPRTQPRLSREFLELSLIVPQSDAD